MFIQISIQRIRFFVLLLIVAIGVMGCDKAKELADSIENKVTGKTDHKTDQVKQDDTANTDDSSSSGSSSNSNDNSTKPTVPVTPEKTPEQVIADFLKIEGPYMKDEHLVALGALESGLDTITAVSLYRSHVTEKGLMELKKLPNLVVLDASEAEKLGGDAAMDIISEMTQLVQLNVSKTGISDAGLAKLATLRQLRALDISKNPSITGSGMAGFRDIPLVAFYAGESKFGQGGLEHIRSTTSLVVLGLQQAHVTDENVRSIGQLKGLRQLDLSGNGVSDKGVTSLGGLVNLEDLILLACNVGNEGIQGLIRCRTLKRLCTAQTMVTQQGVDVLKKGNPNLVLGMIKNLETDVLRYASTDPNIANLAFANATSSPTEPSPPPMPVVRVWTNNDGTKTLKGEFVKFEGGKVVVKLEGGNEIEMTMAQISKEDQEWVREELKRRN